MRTLSVKNTQEKVSKYLEADQSLNTEIKTQKAKKAENERKLQTISGCQQKLTDLKNSSKKSDRLSKQIDQQKVEAKNKKNKTDKYETKIRGKSEENSKLQKTLSMKSMSKVLQERKNDFNALSNVHNQEMEEMELDIKKSVAKLERFSKKIQ